MQNFNFESTPILTLAIWFGIGIMLMLIIGYIYFIIGRKWNRWCEKKESSEREYEELYNEICTHVDEAKMTELSRAIISAELKRLKALDCKNPEKTKKLCIDFLQKFYSCEEMAAKKVVTN